MLLIDKLTPEHEAQIAPTRDRWLRIGLSTEPADRARAQAGVVAAYQAANLPPPKLFIWLQSPLAGCVGSAMLGQVRGQVGGQVRGQVGGQVRGQVGGQVRDQVRGQVLDQVLYQVRDQVWGQVWDQVEGQVGDQVLGQVWDQVRGQVWDQVEGQVWDQVGRAIYGQHEAGWLSFYAFFRDACTLESARRLDGLIQVAESAGWWWPFAGAVVLTERPVHLARDARGRLHCVDRAAIEYSDGWGVYAWHGVRVPERVIKAPETITAAEIDGEQNAEVRRVMAERYGLARYLADSGAKQIHCDSAGTLYRKDLPGDEPIVMVKVRNSTPEPDGSVKDYMLRVPPTIKTARAAVAWTFGVEAKDYRPAIET